MSDSERQDKFGSRIADSFYRSKSYLRLRLGVRIDAYRSEANHTLCIGITNNDVVLLNTLRHCDGELVSTIVRAIVFRNAAKCTAGYTVIYEACTTLVLRSNVQEYGITLASACEYGIHTNDLCIQRRHKRLIYRFGICDIARYEGEVCR